MELMKQIHLFKKGFVIFLKGAPFSDFIETRLSNCKPLAIRIPFPLFWGIFLKLCSTVQTSSRSEWFACIWNVCLCAFERQKLIKTSPMSLSRNFSSNLTCCLEIAVFEPFHYEGSRIRSSIFQFVQFLNIRSILYNIN